MAVREAIGRLLIFAVGLLFAGAALGLAVYVTVQIVGAYIRPDGDVPGGVNTFYGILAGTLIASLIGVWSKTREFIGRFVRRE